MRELQPVTIDAISGRRHDHGGRFVLKRLGQGMLKALGVKSRVPMLSQTAPRKSFIRSP